MAPPPSAAELIAGVQLDARTGDPLDELTTAAATVAALHEVGDSVLDFFVDRCRRGGRSWSEISRVLGVTKQAAHQRFTAPSPAPELFTPRAQRALRAAATEANALGHNYVGTEHVLLGLFEPADGVAAQVLADAGLDRRGVVAEITQRVPIGPTLSGTGSPPYTPRATRTRERAHAEARLFGHNYIGTEHLLLALFDDADSIAAKVLDVLGAERGAVRACVVERLSGYRPSDT